MKGLYLDPDPLGLKSIAQLVDWRTSVSFVFIAL